MYCENQKEKKEKKTYPFVFREGMIDNEKAIVDDNKVSHGWQ